ncbi:MAG TPA: glycosyltransferase [Candidatus Obscuribacterales bacterium]
MALSQPSADPSTLTGAAPRVSVIVPIYNGVADLPGLAAGLLSQTLPPAQVEYLLVDNNSQDDTLSQLQALAAQAQAQGITVIPLTEASIQSSYAARNRGIRAARGEILVFTDADCRPTADWLAHMVMPFDDPQVGLVVGEIQALPGHSLLEQYADRREILSQKFTIAHSFYPYGQTANLAVRRVALVNAGLFRPYLTTGGDADLCWRIQLSGDWRLHFAPAAIIRHRHRATLKELQSQWQRYGRSNAYLHELYGVPLQPYLSQGQLVRRVGRWLVKEVPVAVWRSLRGQVPAVEIIGTPLDLFCRRSRERGQRQAKLQANAHTIEWLEAPPAAAVLKALQTKAKVTP